MALVAYSCAEEPSEDEDESVEECDESESTLTVSSCGLSSQWRARFLPRFVPLSVWLKAFQMTSRSSVLTQSIWVTIDPVITFTLCFGHDNQKKR
mmetsp:Transcript_103203/g.177897  ORF Transcript_103203/g.177897 Transcript_103203/m.177897 type:complete len:95 (+) Transcript_103203:124-408(+)